MEGDLDRRTYDVLRLVEQHGPIGSIRLVDLMHQHGYSIKDRTVRLILSDLDDRGFTVKVPGKGRTLTDAGEEEIRRGDVTGRLERVRNRIATLTSRVSYDPIEDTGSLVTCSATVRRDDLRAALACLERFRDTPVGPLSVAVTDVPGAKADLRRLQIPSSITLSGTLLTNGINAEISTAGVVEYTSARTRSDSEYGDTGGTIRRYVDVINGEGSSIDVIELLIEAGRTTATDVLDDETALLVADERTVPLSRLDESRDLATATRNALGGAITVDRPREDDPTTGRTLPWGFGSVTYAGAGELALSALQENGLITDMNAVYGIEDRAEFEPVRVVSVDAHLE